MVPHIVHTKPLPKGKSIGGCTHVETVQAKYFGASFHTETHLASSHKSDLGYIYFFNLFIGQSGRPFPTISYRLLGQGQKVSRSVARMGSYKTT